MTTYELNEDQRRAVAEYVERRRKRRNLNKEEAASLAGLSSRKWHQVEAATHNHQERTLRLVAKGLGESPRRLLQLAGYPYHDEDDEDDQESIAGLVYRIERLEVLPAEVESLRAEVRELVSVVRSVHHSPGT